MPQKYEPRKPVHWAEACSDLQQEILMAEWVSLKSHCCPEFSCPNQGQENGMYLAWKEAHCKGPLLLFWVRLSPFKTQLDDEILLTHQHCKSIWPRERFLDMPYGSVSSLCHEVPGQRDALWGSCWIRSLLWLSRGRGVGSNMIFWVKHLRFLVEIRPGSMSCSHSSYCLYHKELSDSCENNSG